MAPAMRSRKQSAKKKKASRKADPTKKLVGYWEERERADQIHAALKERGTDTSEYLRNSYRAVLDTNGARKWAMKESAIARLIDLNKATLKSMRDRGALVDEHGPIWRKASERSVTVLYDVARTRKFFGIVDEPDPAGAQPAST
jgi:hypothetical protein